MGLDDLFNGLALVCLIGYSASYDIWIRSDDEPTETKLSVVVGLLQWTTLYLVKASFLALCWTIFSVSTKFRKLWLFVVAYNFLTYVAIMVWVTWPCYRPFDPSAPCSISYNDYRWYHATGQALEAALHSTSEALILVLPLIWIKNLQMSTAQKLGAASVFAIIIIDIIIGLSRNVVQSIYFQGNASDTMTAFLDTVTEIEAGLAVIVCALPAYKVLLPSSQKRRLGADESPNRITAEPSMPLRKTKSTQDWIMESYPSEAGQAEVTEMV